MAVPVQNVCLVGADGTLGTAILAALISSPLTVSILRRTSSTSPPPPPGVTTLSFSPSQLDVLAALERATRTSWTARRVDSAAFLEEQSARLADGHNDAVHEIVFVLGTVDADWTRREDFAMDLLGLEDEHLDAVVARVVREHAETFG
ncbi:hypothetical protein E4U42_005049 [Claviceps africana]|uniref:NmrA-like domain-containing protein n=1 Tax=Claviceps africana TaxID=83212 RepID=A0A8K0NHM1_9HYPO|nr:hypothetical protein E4U42_005049 [Claviceps africana]